MNDFTYIRKTYEVPAKRGMRVRYSGSGRSQLGTIRSARAGYLIIQLDGETAKRPYHPTYCIEYLQPGDPE